MPSSTIFADNVFNNSNYESLPEAKKKFSTTLPNKLVTELPFSTQRASKVCSNVAKDGINPPIPSQCRIFKFIVICGEEQKMKIKKVLREVKDYCLRFNEKRIS